MTRAGETSSQIENGRKEVLEGGHDVLAEGLRLWTEATERIIPTTAGVNLPEVASQSGQWVAASFDLGRTMLTVQRSWAHQVFGERGIPNANEALPDVTTLTSRWIDSSFDLAETTLAMQQNGAQQLLGLAKALTPPAAGTAGQRSPRRPLGRRR